MKPAIDAARGRCADCPQGTKDERRSVSVPSLFRLRRHDANRDMVTGVYSSGAWVTTISGSMP